MIQKFSRNSIIFLSKIELLNSLLTSYNLWKEKLLLLLNFRRKIDRQCIGPFCHTQKRRVISQKMARYITKKNARHSYLKQRRVRLIKKRHVRLIKKRSVVLPKKGASYSQKKCVSILPIKRRVLVFGGN